MPSQQQIWDAELLAEFRAKTRLLTAALRQLQQQEAEAKKRYRVAKKVRKAGQDGFDAMLFADSGADDAFVRDVQQHGKKLAEAEENEREARQDWLAAKKKRQDAKYRLTIHIETFMAPVPLFDGVENPATKRRARSSNGGGHAGQRKRRVT